jgi:hypothetical protein
MYWQCEIIECRAQVPPRRTDSLDVEDVIGMISAGSPSVQESGAY